jgi:hypothetical protein
LKYLFKWNKVPGPDNKKLDFIYNLESFDEMNLYSKITNISKSKDKSTITFKIISDIELEELGNDEIKIEIKINEKKNYQKNENKEAYILISYSDGKTSEIPLVIDEGFGMKNVFIKKSYLPKTIKK